MSDIRNDNPSGFSLGLTDTFGGSDSGFRTSTLLDTDTYEPSNSGGFGSLFESNRQPPSTFGLGLGLDEKAGSGFDFGLDFGTDLVGKNDDLWNYDSDFSYDAPFGLDWSLDPWTYDFGTPGDLGEPRDFDLGWDHGFDFRNAEDRQLGLGLDDFAWSWNEPGVSSEPEGFSLWGDLPNQGDAWPNKHFDFDLGFDLPSDLDTESDTSLNDAGWFRGLNEAGADAPWQPNFRNPTLEPNPNTPGFQLTIEQGDTLSALADSLGVTVDDLLEINPGITRDGTLHIGEKLAVPAWTHSEAIEVRGHANAYTAAERIHAALEGDDTKMAKIVEIRRAIASAGPGEGGHLIDAMRKMALDEDLMTSLDPRSRELVQEQIHNLGGSTIEYLEPVIEQIAYGYVEGMADGVVEAVEAFKSLFRAQTWKDLGAFGTTAARATFPGYGLIDPDGQSDAMAELVLMTQASWESFWGGWQDARANGTTARYLAEAAGGLTTEAFAGAATGAAATAAKTGLRLGLSAGEAATLSRLVDGIETASSWRTDWMPDEALGMLSDRGQAALRAVHKAHELDNNKGLLPEVIEQKKVERNVALSKTLADELSPEDMARFSALLESRFPDLHRGAYRGMDPSRLPSLEARNINLDHIFQPDVTYKPGRNGRLKATVGGYHHRPDGVDAPGVRLVDSSVADRNGVYSGYVEFTDPLTGSWMRSKYKTFFPDSWSPARIELEVAAAFRNRQPGAGLEWRGRSPSGVMIEGWLDPSGNLNTAYPVPWE